MTSNNVQDAIVEAFLNPADTDNQDAEEVPIDPITNMTATEVQSALEELQGDIDTWVDTDTDDQTAIEVPFTAT